MTRPVSDASLQRFSEFLTVRLGLHFPAERWRDLRRALDAAAEEYGFEDTEDCVEWLMNSATSAEQMDTLVGQLTVGETYFFRDRPVFAVLQEQIIPQLLSARSSEPERHLRIWSAGCSTGEEAYSIAIALARTVPDRENWNVSVLATDVNRRSLRKASRGIYGDWSFRDVPRDIKDAYFRTVAGKRFEVTPHIKALVTFDYLNLVDDVYPSVANRTNAMDIIFCRNVLMYLHPTKAQAVIEKLSRCLVEGGWLILSPVEVSLPRSSDLRRIGFSDTVLLRKDTGGASGGSTATSITSYTDTAPGSAPLDVLRARARSPAVPPRTPRRKSRATRTPAMRQSTRQLALDCYAQGRYPEAIEITQKYLAQNKNDAEMAALLARSYANQGQFADAIPWCRNAMAGDKLNPAWPYLLASILEETGNAEQAVSLLRRTLYIEPNYVLAHFALGNLARRQGSPAESLRHFQNALAALNDYPGDHVLPESGGITAARMGEVIRSMISTETQA